jgi:hypothetical protein
MIAYSMDSLFKRDDAKNFDTELIFRNNEYIYIFKRSKKLVRKTYYFKFMLFEK